MAFKVIKPPRGVQLDKSHPLARGLVGCWLFNEGCGTKVFDLSGNDLTGSLTNMTEADWVSSEKGMALDFDGDNDEVNVEDDPVLRVGGEGTVESWIYAHTIPTAVGFFEKDGGGYNDDMAMGVNVHSKAPGKLVLAFNRTPETDIPFLADTVNFPTDEWIHAVGTWDPGGMALYKNGALLDANAIPCEMIASGIDARIGRWGTYSLDGLILLTRLWKRSLTGDEIRWLRREPYAVFERPLEVAYYIVPTEIVKIMGSTVQATEALLRRGRAIRLKPSTVQLTETLSRRMWSIRLLAEALSVPEGVVRRARSIRPLASTVNLTETLIRVPLLIKLMASTVAVTEGIVRRMRSILQMISALSVPEGTVRRARSIRLMPSTLSVPEGFVKVYGFIKMMAETVSVPEGAVRRMRSIRIKASTLSVAEGVVHRMRSIRQMVSTLSMPETFVKWDIRRMAETLSVPETLIRRGHAIRFLASTVNLSENVLRRARSIRLVASTANLTETFVRATFFIRLMASTIVVIETLPRRMRSVRQMVSILGLVENWIKKVILGIKVVELESSITKEVELESEIHD